MDRRRRLMVISLSLAPFASVGCARARKPEQESVAAQAGKSSGFPTRPIVLIVPWPEGGSTDICMRALAEATTRQLGQPVVVENRPGASGVLGAIALTKAAPDGYTLSQLPYTVFRMPYLVDRPPFDPQSDFTYLDGVSTYTFGVAVRSDAPWHDWNELLEYARENPNKVLYGTPGTFTSPHITMHEIAVRHGIRWVHTPFRGSAEDMEALLGGDIHVAADSSSWGPYVDAGKMRLLTTWGERRTRHWPMVPTLVELGENIVSNTPYGIAGPKGMDPQVAQVLQEAFRKGIEDPQHLNTLAKYDQEPWYKSGDEYTRWARQAFVAEKVPMEQLKSTLR